jgi:hypothetical protein
MINFVTITKGDDTMPMQPPMAQHLGDMIELLNPYSSGARAGYSTGEMDFYAGKDTPVIPPAGDIRQFIIEVDNKYAGDYAGEWSFKGQPQRIAKAVRFRYRFPVLDQNGAVLYYVDDYLLVGYEGSNS